MFVLRYEIGYDSGRNACNYHDAGINEKQIYAFNSNGSDKSYKGVPTMTARLYDTCYLYKTMDGYGYISRVVNNEEKRHNRCGIGQDVEL